VVQRLLYAYKKLIFSSVLRILGAAVAFGAHALLLQYYSLSEYGVITAGLASLIVAEGVLGTKSFEIGTVLAEKYDNRYYYDAFFVDFILIFLFIIITNILYVLKVSYYYLFVYLIFITVRGLLIHDEFKKSKGLILSKIGLIDNVLRVLLIFYFRNDDPQGLLKIIAFSPIVSTLYSMQFASNKKLLLVYPRREYLHLLGKSYTVNAVKSFQNGMDLIILNFMGFSSVAGVWSIITKTNSLISVLGNTASEFFLSTTVRFSQTIDLKKYQKLLRSSIIWFFVLNLFLVFLIEIFIGLGVQMFAIYDNKINYIYLAILGLGVTTQWWTKYFSLSANPWYSIHVVLINIFVYLLLVFLKVEQSEILSLLIVIPVLRFLYWWILLFRTIK